MAHITIHDIADNSGDSPRAPLNQLVLWLTPDDNVAAAKTALKPGTVLLQDETAGPSIAVRQFIPSGHKIALQPIAPGTPVIRYGQIIGFASEAIAAGDHVHTHNVVLHPVDSPQEYGVAVRPVEIVPEAQRRTFLGYQRDTGHAGTRNYIAVVATVNCAAHACREIAAYFTRERLAAFPNVDGVIPIVHGMGCTDRVGSLNYTVLQRTLAGVCRHPNVAACVLVGLGCEVNQPSEVIENYRLQSARVVSLAIQDCGGIRKTTAAAITALEQQLLPIANTARRTPLSVSELAVALQCGGSDSWSGVTANPVMGRVADELVRQGGTAVLAETPEICGAESILTRRAVHPDIAQKLMDRVAWWHEYAAMFGLEINNNPSTGNKAGGLTTIYEKSLGAVAKGGSTPLVDVYEYAEPVTAQGFVFMDSPGYDPVSVTGQVAGGCNVVLFSTGRGSVFGCALAPSIKIATNTAMFEHMLDDMDFNAGTVLDTSDLDHPAADLFELMLATASGQPSKSEAQGVGTSEFVPWQLSGVL